MQAYLPSYITPAHRDLRRAPRDSLSHDLEVTHLVDESLLRDTISLGHVDEGITARIGSLIDEAIKAGADLVLCTCSSIGAVAEEMNAMESIEIQRIDRAMADEAVRIGGRILLAAALGSTLGPTAALLRSSAQAAGKEIQIREIIVPKAWPMFEAGDRSGYVDTIATCLRQEAADSDVIVLAQASMAEAAARLEDMAIPVLSSPLPGLRKALAALGVAI